MTFGSYCTEKTGIHGNNLSILYLSRSKVHVHHTVCNSLLCSGISFDLCNLVNKIVAIYRLPQVYDSHINLLHQVGDKNIENTELNG